MHPSRIPGTLLRLACVALSCACVSGSPDGEGGSGQAADSAGVAPIVARAEAAIASGDLDAGIDGYREAYERTPWNDRIASALVAAYVARADNKRAKPGGSAGLALANADLRAALVISPQQPGLQRNLAIVLLEQAAVERDEEAAAKFRAEASALAPDLAAQTPTIRLPIERRMDIAYDLLERGQIDAGLDQLESLVRDYPESTAAAQLLAQALVRKGGAQTQRGDYAGARQSYARAVEVYARLLPCDGTRCTQAELSLAHRNRISALLDGASFDEARAALAEANGLGLEFPDLERRWPELKSR